MEVELIPVDAVTRRICPLDAEGAASTLPFLRRHGNRHEWVEGRSAEGAAHFLLPGGGEIGFEPGGQIEYSTPPCHSATALLELLRSVVAPLQAAAADEGIEVLCLGIDPRNPVEQAPLQLAGERYLQMAQYFKGFGPAGARMMRQTAAFQVSLDFGEDPLLRWRVLNAAAPYALAIFANSPLYEGRPTGHRSYRAHAWRELDPGRTGIFGPHDDPPARYLDFALQARGIFRRTQEGEYLPFQAWLARGAGLADWRAHLTTLFPEVRPRGYLEVRCIDAVAPEWFPAPLALLTGLAYDPTSLRLAGELLRTPDPELLPRAGAVGLGDPAIARVARDLFEIAIRGCTALGPEFLGPGDLEVARAFFQRYTARDRSPADDALESVLV